VKRPFVVAALSGLGLLFLGLGAAGANEWALGKQAMSESRHALALGKVREATVLARRAAEATIPGSPYAAQGFEELEIIARAAEAQGKLHDAAFAWSAMRSAAEATRPCPAAAGRLEEALAGMLRVARASRISRIVPPEPSRGPIGKKPA
jgi:hypothetical protein